MTPNPFLLLRPGQTLTVILLRHADPVPPGYTAHEYIEGCHHGWFGRIAVADTPGRAS
jgi:hypothetical protein